jgi:hypothetical protein
MARGLQQQRGVARSRDGDGEVSRQSRKGLDPVAIVDRIELGLSCRAGSWSLVEGRSAAGVRDQTGPKP